MKKIILIILVVCQLTAIVSCAADRALPQQETPPSQITAQSESPGQMTVTAITEPAATKSMSSTISVSAQGPYTTGNSVVVDKLAIITTEKSRDPEWHSVQPILKKYGTDRILHVTWPGPYMEENAKMIELVDNLSTDASIKAVIVNPAVPGTIEAFQTLREKRKDILVIFCNPVVNIFGIREVDIARTADLILTMDHLGMAPDMVTQAQKLGAKTFVHYSTDRYRMDPVTAKQHDLIRDNCETLGIQFISVIIPDPLSEEPPDAHVFLTNSIQETTARYGKDTAFFLKMIGSSLPGTLIKEVVDTGALFPQPAYPSPFSGLDYGLFGTYIFGDGCEVNPVTYEETYISIADPSVFIERTRAALAEKNMLGRVST